MHQQKVSQELSNRINVLTTLLISSEFEVEKIHCPCCGSPENIDYTLVLQKMEKVFVEKFNVQTVSLLLMLIILKL